MKNDYKKFIRKEALKDIKEISDPMEELSEDEKLNLILKDTFIDLENKEYKEPPAYLSLKDIEDEFVSICTPANISAITGKAKSKKSYFQNLLISAVVSNSIKYNTIKANMPNNKKDIVLFDTEQSVYHVSRATDRINKLIGYKAKNLYVYSLRGLEADMIIKLITHITDINNNIGMIFIDQIADLAKSINNEEEAVKIVRLLERISKEKDLHICCVIHQNKGDGYASGWLGSQIMKKSETVISVEKDVKDFRNSFISPDLTRNKPFVMFGIRINANGMPEIMNEKDEQVNINAHIEPEEDFDYKNETDIPF